MACNITIVSAEEIAKQRDYCKKSAPLLVERFGHTPIAFVHSYGCQQNVSDGERIKGMLAEIGIVRSVGKAKAHFGKHTLNIRCIRKRGKNFTILKKKI